MFIKVEAVVQSSSNSCKRLTPFKKSVAVISIIALVAAMSPAAAFGASAVSAAATQGVPASTQEQQRENTGAMPDYIPSKSVHDANEGKLSTQSASTLPDSYSSVSEGYITNVKNQQFTQHCWAFAAIAAIEASMIKEGLVDAADKDALDLAERQLAYFFYNTPTDPLGNTTGDSTDLIVDGKRSTEVEPKFAVDFAVLEHLDYLSGLGNLNLTMAALANWIGASEENKAPFEELANAYYTEREACNSAIWAKYEELNNSLEDGESFDDNYGSEFDTFVDNERKTRASNFLDMIKLDDLLAFDDLVHLQNAYRIDMSDSDDVKQAIIDYGAVVTQINSSWSAQVKPGHYYTNSGTYTNHEVALVGWDDNYPKENFASDDSEEPEMPAKDGAWLFKNSWGTDNGVDIDGDGEGDGYYWISYETSSFKSNWASVVAYDMAWASDWDNNYQYDGSTCNNMNNVSTGGSIANVYEAKGNADGAETLGAVMVCLADPNVDYSVQVYLNPQAGDPTSGMPMLTEPVTGKTSYTGYYTIDLGQEVPLHEGDTFAVVVTLSLHNNSNVNYVVDSSCGVGDRYADGWNWVHFTSAVSPGQSFEMDKANGKWEDLATAAPDGSDEPNCCARLKAFTKNVAIEDLPAIDIVRASASVSDVTYTGKALEPAVTVKCGTKALVQGSDFAVEYANNKNAGTATAVVTGTGSYTGALPISFTIAKAKQTLKVSTKAKSVKFSKLKKKAQATSKVAVSGAKTKVTYKKAGGSGKLSINKKTGKITVKKGTKKGTYKIKVKATAAKSTNYNAATKTATVKVKVK